MSINKKTCEVVSLPTNNKSHLCFLGDDLVHSQLGVYSPDNRSFKGYQQLYILSEEKVCKGDYFIQDCCVLKSNYDLDWQGFYKVIASTDSNLNLPQLPRWFVDYFVSEYNLGNLIKTIDVIYEEDLWIQDYGFSPDYPLPPLVNLGGGLAVNPDNTISIKHVKTSWNRDELELLMQQYGDYVSNRVLQSQKPIYKSSKEYLLNT